MIRDNPHVWRPLFFALNFALAAVLTVWCSIAVVQDLIFGASSPFSFLGGFCFMWPAMAVAIAEWVLFVRNDRSWERPLGVLYGWVGGLALFAFCTNAIESIARGNRLGLRSWLEFGAACFVVGGYGFLCCWFRLRPPGDRPTDRGFPVKLRDE